MKLLKLAVLTVTAITLLAITASADNVIAYASVAQVGNQYYNGTLGLDFNVNAGYTAEISSLGAFVGINPANGKVYTTLQTPMTVGIFDRNTGLLVGPSATFTSGTIIGGDMFVSVNPFTLLAGEYSVVAFGYGPFGYGLGLANANEVYSGATILSTLNTYGGALTFVGGGRYGSHAAGFVFPTNLDRGPGNRYQAGTFIYTDSAPVSAPVPEPASLFLLGSGLVALGGLVRKFR